MAALETEGIQYIGQCPPHLGETYIDIPLPGGGTNRTMVVWPKASSGSKPLDQCPLIVHFHGGGFATCSPGLMGAPARGIAAMLSSVVACPSLNQLPEQPFPAPIEAAWEVCAWLSDTTHLNGGVLKHESTRVDTSRGFIVGGLSAGGTAAAVIAGITGAASANMTEFAHLSPFRSPITGLFVGIPVTVTEDMIPEKYRSDLKSRVENTQNGGMDLEMIREMERMINLVHTPWFSPLNLDVSGPRTTKDHPGKVFIYCCSLDAFRDDAIIYQKWLSEHVKHVESRLVLMEGENHIGWVSPPWPQSHSRKMKEMTLDGMAWLLGADWDRTKPLPV